MPADPPSSEIAADSATPTDPVLAGFARLAIPPAPDPEPEPIDPALDPFHAGLARLERQRALEAQRPPVPAPPPAPNRWSFPSLPRIPWQFGLLVASLVIGRGVMSLREHRHAPPPSNLAVQAIHDYAWLCNSEIVEPLRAANNGQLTGEQALQVIEKRRPVIAKNTWTAIADRFTALQDDQGHLPQAETAAFLDEISSGLTSFR